MMTNEEIRASQLKQCAIERQLEKERTIQNTLMDRFITQHLKEYKKEHHLLPYTTQGRSEVIAFPKDSADASDLYAVYCDVLVIDYEKQTYFKVKSHGIRFLRPLKYAPTTMFIGGGSAIEVPIYTILDDGGSSSRELFIIRGEKPLDRLFSLEEIEQKRQEIFAK